MAAKKTEPSKLERLRALAQEVNADLKGEGSVIVAADVKPSERIETGILALDTIMGGGLPRGQLVELHGEESCGKSLLSLLAIAAVQRKGGTAVGAFREGYDTKWAAKQGVNNDDLYRIDTATGDTSLEAIMTLVEQGVVDLAVLDSFQSFGTAKEVEKGIEQESMGGGGANQMWGRIMRRAYAAANMQANSGVPPAAWIGISQVRAAIGKFSPHGQPDPEPAGSRAIKHWKAISIQCKKGEIHFSHKQKDDKRRIVGRTFHLHCQKNKTSAPERVSQFTYFFMPHDIEGPDGEIESLPPGIDYADEAFRLGKAYGLIDVAGAWIEGYGIRKQGGDKFLWALRHDMEALETLRLDILDASMR